MVSTLWLLTPLLGADVSFRTTWNAGHCFKKSEEGFWSLPSNEHDCRRKLIYDGGVIETKMTTDGYGRRNVFPAPSRKKKRNFVATLGCSFTFGEGVNDDETYPSQIAKLAPLTAVYNYGVAGYGPNNMLQLISSKNLAEEIPQQRGKFIYLWLEDHVLRSIGALSHSFWDFAPHYFLDVSGEPVFDGSIRNAQPFRDLLFRVLRPLRLNERLGINIPPRITVAHLQLVSAILRKIEKTTSHAFPDSEFYLVLYMKASTPRSKQIRDELFRVFSGTTVHILDYSEKHLAGGNLPDGHPSPELYRSLGTLLVKDLKLR